MAEPPPIPDKRYLTIGELSELCGEEDHVLRYWEQEFPQLQPVRRNGRRYYQREDVILVRRIQALLRQQGMTISGARTHLSGEGARQEHTESRQLVRQMIAELEDVLRTLRDG